MTSEFKNNPTTQERHWLDLVENIREKLHILQHKTTGQWQVVTETIAQNSTAEWSPIAILPAIYPEWLGSQEFLSTHQLRFPYIVGEMANGIATAKMVVAAAQAGMMGFFGAGGLPPSVIEENIVAIKNQLQDKFAGWGANLIHSPQEPRLEGTIVDLYIRHGVQRVSASAYMSLNPHLVYYACKGLTTSPSGDIVRRHHIVAKISRPEVARLFMSPAPQDMLESLVQAGRLTAAEAQLAARVPLAEDITVEGDSGGHTDNRPLVGLFPTIYQLAQQISATNNYTTPLRIGAAGGLGTPTAVAAAFTMGAAYVLTGSINQSAVESGLSDAGKVLLGQAGIADVMMAPASDMFELGVKLQILKRGCLFGSRANKLYDIYSRFDSLAAIPESEKTILEKQIFMNSLAAIWDLTKSFFQQRDPEQVVLAERDPKHQMALVFRWYLGLSSRWAIQGNSERKMDYQIWCGPAMGAFNAWVADSFLADLSARNVAQIGRNLLEGAAVTLRAQQLRSCGLHVPAVAFNYRPRPLL